jgi:predicted nucleic acid-binding protein
MAAIDTKLRLRVPLRVDGSAPVDFADCLHSALAREAGESPLLTFDKSAARIEGARLLPA